VYIKHREIHGHLDRESNYFSFIIIRFSLEIMIYYILNLYISPMWIKNRCFALTKKGDKRGGRGGDECVCKYMHYCGHIIMHSNAPPLTTLLHRIGHKFNTYY